MQKKGPLNDRSLTLVRKEFDRLKGSNGYSEYVIGEYIDSGGYARVYAVNSLRGNGEKPWKRPTARSVTRFTAR